MLYDDVGKIQNKYKFANNCSSVPTIRLNIKKIVKLFALNKLYYT